MIIYSRDYNELTIAIEAANRIAREEDCVVTVIVAAGVYDFHATADLDRRVRLVGETAVVSTPPNSGSDA